jgi:hypothetical protein
MASVTGSRLAFFTPTAVPSAISMGLTSDGITVPAPSTVSGAFNIEVFTASPSGGFSLATGYQAAVFVQGAVSLSNNAVQAATSSSTEVLGPGSYQVIDLSGNQAITIAGSSVGGSNITVTGSSGDTVTGSTVSGNTQLIDASGTNALVNPGPMTITGGAGPTTVWAGSSDRITGGAGTLLAAGDKSSFMTISGGAGNLNTFNFGTKNSVTGSTAGTTFIDDNYGGSGNTLVGGAASTTIIGGPSDLITGGAGAMLVNALSGPSTITGGSGSTTIWGAANESITGGSGALLVAGNAASGETIKGGTGNLFAFNFGKNDSVVGSSSGTSFIDDNYGGGGSNTIKGGAGATTVIAGASDSIIGGAGLLQVGLHSNYTGDTIDLTAAGRGAASIRDNGVSGPTVGTSTVTGFSTSTDVIQSATSVDATNAFIGSSTTDIQGNTVLSFLDGSTMTLVGVSNVIQVKFTQ